MKLYYFPGSCALAPHTVLEWLGADFEPERIVARAVDTVKSSQILNAEYVRQ